MSTKSRSSLTAAPRVFVTDLALLALLALLAASSLYADSSARTEIAVSDTAGLRRALSQAKPGNLILLAPGAYEGDVYARQLHGKPGRSIVIAGAEQGNRPVIRGRAECLHFSDCTHLELRDLILESARTNGLNMDDGGSFETPAHHIVLRRVTVRSVGTRGNQDGIKLSGVDDFRLEDCTIERWGRGGSAVDMVGCHRGLITGCVFRDRESGAAANAVQTKGGSCDITVRSCRFEHAGQRAVNIGGSTGRPFFRPKPPRGYEAKDITVEGCIFVGSAAPVAYVGVDGAAVKFNTIYRPRKWFLRILQETRAPDFVPCRKGRFTDNLIVYRSDEVRTAVNVGPGTAPDTFVAARNFWYCLDQATRSQPRLPFRETDGEGAEDPLLVDPEKGDFHLKTGSPAIEFGAYALPHRKRQKPGT